MKTLLGVFSGISVGIIIGCTTMLLFMYLFFGAFFTNPKNVGVEILIHFKGQLEFSQAWKLSVISMALVSLLLIRAAIAKQIRFPFFMVGIISVGIQPLIMSYIMSKISNGSIIPENFHLIGRDRIGLVFNTCSQLITFTTSISILSRVTGKNAFDSSPPTTNIPIPPPQEDYPLRIKRQLPEWLNKKE
jgi:hypothetical protein